MAFQMNQLPYSYDALEPFIDAPTMEIHYSKHYQSYCNHLNEAVSGTPYEKMEIEEVLRRGANELPEAIRNHGGGYANHNLFWKIIGPRNGAVPAGDFVEAIRSNFKTFHEFKENFTSAAKALFGSGWIWLVVNQDKLEVISTANQDSPFVQGKIPILGLDVWEHAYYLKYQNKRPDYIYAWWSVVNWQAVQQLYSSVVKK